MATHSSVLAWRIPGMGEPDGLPSMGSHRVGHNRSDLAAAAAGLGDEWRSWQITLHGAAESVTTEHARKEWVRLLSEGVEQDRQRENSVALTWASEISINSWEEEIEWARETGRVVGGKQAWLGQEGQGRCSMQWSTALHAAKKWSKMRREE